MYPMKTARTKLKPANKTFFFFSGWATNIETKIIVRTAIAQGFTESANASKVILLKFKVSGSILI